MQKHKRFTVVCGHYGTGKTNLSINLAVQKAAGGNPVSLIDLDLVNPYFRSSDYTEFLKSKGVKVIAPVYAGTTLDLPAIPPEIDSVFESGEDVIFDVGGDDAGSIVLGRFSQRFRPGEYEMLYVVNRYRVLTTKPEEAAALLREIESASRLKATAVVNNSHLKQLTTAQDIENSLDFAKSTAKFLNLPLLFTTAPEKIADSLEIENLYPVKIYVRSPWEIEAD